MSAVKTLLIGLDNPHSRNPAHALLPMPDGATGHKIVQIIGTVVEGYSASRYLRDFGRLNLYVGERARSGRGSAATDRLLASMAMQVLSEGGYLHAVLFGKRVQDAFADFMYAERADLLLCLPHPSGRNRWYNNFENKLYAARLLESLRANRTQEVLHHDEPQTN